MAKFLVRAADSANPDPETGYRKGDVIAVVDDIHAFSPAEGLPDFVQVEVTGLDVATVRERAESWLFDLGYEIVGQNVGQDGVRVRVYSEVPGAANQAGITRERAESWLNNWGASVVSAAQNEVRFDITVQDAYMSAGFWGVDPATYGVSLTEQDYNQQTGVHVVAAVANSAQRYAQMLTHIRQSGADITFESPGTFTAIAEFTRAQVREHFVEALKFAMHKVTRRRRYAFSAADVDTAIAAGGVVSLTQAQLVAKLVDKAA